jgi:hypothetical protein
VAVTLKLIPKKELRRIIVDSTVQEKAIEPIIGHLKADHRMNRCHLKGSEDNSLHAVLCAAGFNIRRLLRMIAKKGLDLFYATCRCSDWGNLRGNCVKFLYQNH